MPTAQELAREIVKEVLFGPMKGQTTVVLQLITETLQEWTGSTENNGTYGGVIRDQLRREIYKKADVEEKKI